jgi:hypothetical protein
MKEMERALVKDVVVRLRSRRCFVNVRAVLSSIPMTRSDSEGPVVGIGELEPWTET